jgi:phosphoenolpyruvate-protein kinase (PTS system EI component)
MMKNKVVASLYIGVLLAVVIFFGIGTYDLLNYLLYK